MSGYDNARDFALWLIDHGATVGWMPGVDTGDHQYVAIEAVRNGRRVKATWHTRKTGTYQLFSVLIRGDVGDWRDDTIARAKALIEEATCDR